MNAMQKSIFNCLSVLLLLAGCSQEKPSSAPKAVQSPVPASSVSLPQERDPLPLAERLMHEAADHPEARQRVEQAFTRFRAAGITLTRTRQVLARPLSAEYCASGLTAAGLGLALCAFRDEGAALQGRELSRRSFDALIPGRALHVQARSLLTITKPANDQARDEAERIRAGFMQGHDEPFKEHAAL
jgi:hypothetical protein